LNADLLFAGASRSIAVADGRIAAVGTRAELAGIAAARTIELGERAVVPGFIDAHAHLLFHSIFARQLDARCAVGAPLDEILARITAAPGAAGWLRAWGFAPYRVRERRGPTLGELDAACPSRPFVLLHVNGHTAQLNSAGLRALSIDSATGVLHERAMQPFSLGAMARELLASPIDEQIETIAAGAASFAALGITTTCDAMTSPAAIALYREVARRDRLASNVVAMPFHEWSDPPPPADRAGRVRAGAVKLFADGSLSGCTAAVTEPYAGTHERGLLHHTQEEVDALVRALDERGHQIAIHAIGDRAIAQALRALAPVTRGGNPRRHRLEHVGVVTPAIVDELARQQIVIATQPRMLFEQGDAFARACPDRVDRIYPYRTLIARGLRVAGSSDCPVVSADPLLGMRSAILRATEEGAVLAPGERLDAPAALRMWTEDAAYSLFMEHERGRLAAGMAADLVVLSRDPLAAAAEALGRELVVEETYVAGERVYARRAQNGASNATSPATPT
jgi:predicted amidohydrolase YtcJ